MFGIIWIGHLYFLNLVNVPFQGDLDKELKPKINPKLLLRVFFWFRNGAMATFVFGWLLFAFKYVYQGLLFNPEGGMSNRGAWILFGAIIGSIMWFNVWFIIWPRQKQILGGVLKGTPHPQAAEMAATALKASRFNLYASGPMLFGMIVPNNWPRRPSHVDGDRADRRHRLLVRAGEALVQGEAGGIAPSDCTSARASAAR